MPEETEVETQDLQDEVDEIRKEQREEKAEYGWVRWVSLSTALLAVVAAVAALHSGQLINEALMSKNEAVLSQAQASDQWAYYQAKGIKYNTSRQSADLLALVPGGTSRAAKWKADAEKYRKQQLSITDVAHRYESERDQANREAARLVGRHELFAICVTFTQIAIALAAIAALTRRRAVWVFGLVIGAIGVALLAYGYLRGGIDKRAARSETVSAVRAGSAAD